MLREIACGPQTEAYAAITGQDHNSSQVVRRSLGFLLYEIVVFGHIQG